MFYALLSLWGWWCLRQENYLKRLMGVSFDLLSSCCDFYNKNESASTTWIVKMRKKK